MTSTMPSTKSTASTLKPLELFTEQAYLDYSMYVILDRALPHLADGLKPVQRRIIYAMSELGLSASAKFKKSARTVGDVLGKFHPHGDQACYEAMVLMAQPFSYRYPFVDGQGNWGSADDPKSFAAMRYTEARLSRYAALLLDELEQGTVAWVDNFDATLQEPELLPAQVPNILLNGATGIAVGMSADLLPHNLTEVVNACVEILDNPSATLDDLLRHIKGPDFPTDAEIVSNAIDIRQMYDSGLGSIRMRAVYDREGEYIVIRALPYQVSGAKVIEQIALQMQQKRLPMVQDLRDESDHEHPTRLVIIPRSSKFDADELMSHLFATTDLERTYRVNMNMIGLDGKPAVKPLLLVLSEWLQFRLSTVRRRLSYRLQKVEDRLHILEGLLVAFLNIDEIISIIREEEQPKITLMQRYDLTERQADAILDLKLRHLAKLEEITLRSEHDDLSKLRSMLEAILGSEKKLRNLVKDELISIRDRMGDPRRSMLVDRAQAQVIKEEETIPSEPMTIFMSEKAWVRTMKGFDADGSSLTYKASDSFKMQVNARRNQSAYFFDDVGRVYSLPVHQLPSARGQGEPLNAHLHCPDGASFQTMTSGDPDSWVVLATTAGYGFRTQVKELSVKNRSGKVCISLTPGAKLLTPLILNGRLDGLLACVNTSGRLLLFPIDALSILSKGKGTKLMSLVTGAMDYANEYLLSIEWVPDGASLLIQAGKRQFQLHPKDLARYTSSRAKRGNLLPRGLQNVTLMKAIIHES